MEINFPEYFENISVMRLIILTGGLLLIWVAVKIIRLKLLNKIQDPDKRYNSKKILSFVGFFTAAILLLSVYSHKLSGLGIAFGVAGAGIAFALQEVIASFAGWLAIMLGGFYKTGDRVQLGGIKGDVMDIGVLRTTVMETGQWVDGDLYNGRIVLIANSFVFKEPVFNYSGDFPFLWDEIRIPIQYHCNYEKARTIIEQAGREVAGDLTDQSKKIWIELQHKYRLEDAHTEPKVFITANDNWVEFTLRYVVNFRKRRATKTELYTRILKSVEESGGEVKFASATFHLVEAPEFKVTLRSDR